MSISVNIYTEAKINGEWTNIDLWTRYGDQWWMVTCLEGGSTVYSTVRNHDEFHRIPTEELFHSLGRTDEPYGTCYAMSASWLAAKDLELPEYSGYLPRQQVLDYTCGVLSELDTWEMITPAEYRKLTPDEQMGYQFYEWTESWGERDILRRIKRGVHDRINAFNDYCREWNSAERSFVPAKVEWTDVRVIAWAT